MKLIVGPHTQLTEVSPWYGIIRKFDTEEDSLSVPEKQIVVCPVLCVRLYNIFLRPMGDLLHTMMITYVLTYSMVQSPS